MRSILTAQSKLRVPTRLLLALLACALALSCSDHGSPALSSASAAPHAPTRLTAAPRPSDLPTLDQAAQELVRNAAAELDRDIDRPELWTNLGIVYHAHRQFELARTCYEQRLLRAEDDARTWYFLALTEEELGDPRRAIADLEHTLRIDPGYPPAHWRTGYLRLGLGELEAARASMEAALAIVPQDAAAVVGLARVRLQLGEHAAAIALLEQHLERIPRDANARFLLGTAYRAAGRTDEAARVLAGASGAEPVREDPWQGELLAHRRGYRTEFLRAVELLDRGELERATALLEDLHRRQPEDTLIHINLHRACRMKGDLERAIGLLLEARSLDPLQDVVYLHLAGAYRDKARRPEGPPDVALLAMALDSARRACELSPTYAAAHAMRGDVLFDLEQTDSATDAYLQAARLDVNSAMWQEKAGRLLCRAGRWEEAVPVLQRLDVLQPRSARTLFLLGAALANTGKLAEGRAALEQARALAPGDAAVQKALDDVERNLREGAPAPRPGGENGG